MRVQPYNHSKISLASFANSSVVSFSHRAMPSLPNHISVSQDLQIIVSPPPQTHFKVEQKAQKKRRKIFQHQQPQPAVKNQVKYRQRSKEKTKREQMELRKVKSHVALTSLPTEEIQIERRIEEINYMLQSHRIERSFNLSNQVIKQGYQTEKGKLVKIEEKLYQNTESIKAQQEMISSKIPSFQEKIDANNKAIGSMSCLIKQKLQQDRLNMQNLMQMMNKSQTRLKTKQVELGKANTELLHKQSELVRNKEISKKKELELIRIKRIEDLQNRNLQLYQQIQKSRAISQFQDFVQDSNGPEQWGHNGDKVSGLIINQQSTIKHMDTGLNASVSANNTIGEILSPLALNEQQYFI